jgi:hypothetical protein
MNLLRSSLLAFALTTGLLSCNKDDTPAEPLPPGWCGVGQPCDPNVICTEEFASVTVRIIGADSTAVGLDSFQTTYLDGTPLTSATGQPVYNLLPTMGPGPELHATLVNDLWVAGHQNYFVPVKARGWKAGSLVFEQEYVIGADCCHVSKVDGPDVIVVP